MNLQNAAAPHPGKDGGAGAIQMPNPTPEQEIALFLTTIFRPGDVFEVRAPKCRQKPDSDFTSTLSGYVTYDKIEDAAKAIAEVDQKALAPGLYVTMNPVYPELLARATNTLKHRARATTSDGEIVRRHWTLVDCDPERPADISSTDAEVERAIGKAEQIRAALSGDGWPEPVVVMSGNGAHLLYAIDLPADDSGQVERVLAALAARFDGDGVKVDRSVHNPARITRIPGTTARKGDPLVGHAGIEDRPHRRARILSLPRAVRTVPTELLEKLAAKTSKVPLPPQLRAGVATAGGRSWAEFERFEHTPDGVRGYFQGHGIPVTSEKPVDGGTWLYLDRCPVVPDCVATGTSDIGVFVGDNGVIGYKNLHDRGAGLGWLDVREALEPGYKEFAAEQQDDDDAGGRKTQRDKIVAVAREQFRFGRTLADEVFAVPRNGPNIARMLRGGTNSLRAELAREFAQQHGSAPSSGALADAMLVLEGDALVSEPEPVYLRLARHGELIALDLGDTSGRAVVAAASGWAVVDRPPVLFRRTALTAPLPAPVRGGSLDRLRALINVSGPAWPLAVGWLVAALIPDIEHPIVLLGGQQDSGKSTTGRSLAGLVDPSTATLMAPPRELEQWAVTAVGSWVVVVDNISGIAEWLSDALCRAVTGDGLVRRSLYTNDALSVLVFQRCIILTSIDAGGLKGDLGRRLVLLDLEPIDRKKKRRPKALRAEYDAARPGLLGALLDVLVRVLGVLPSIDLDEFHGLADFEQVLAAADRVLATESLAQYRAQWTRIAADVVEGDAVAEAVRAFAQRECQLGHWQGTAGDLLRGITPTQPPKDWPRSPRKFGGLLRRAAPVLLALGVEIIPPNSTDKTREYVMRLTAPPAQPPEIPPGGGPNGDSDVGGAPDGSPDSPADPPMPEPVPPPEDADVGPLGGSGGDAAPSSLGAARTVMDSVVDAFHDMGGVRFVGLLPEAGGGSAP